MSLWEGINDVLFTLASAAVKGLTSEIPLKQIGAVLVQNGVLKDNGSGTATQRQLGMVLSEIKKHGGECEVIIKGNETHVRVNFKQGSSKLHEM